MSYLEEHLDWVRARGGLILPPNRAVSQDEPVPPVDPTLLSALPPDVAEWYEARLWGRTRGASDVLAVDGSLYAPEWGVDFREELPEYYEELASLGWLPKSPKPIVESERLLILVETMGDKAGWLYSYHPGDLGPCSGPFAKSIPQYLSAVRRLVEVGLMDMSGSPAWLVDDTSASSPWPPNDTPGPLTGESEPTFVRDGYFFLEKGEPLSRSIRDILPDFEIVTGVGCIGDVPI